MVSVPINTKEVTIVFHTYNLQPENACILVGDDCDAFSIAQLKMFVRVVLHRVRFHP